MKTVNRKEPRAHVRSKPFCGFCGMEFRTFTLRYQHAPKCRGTMIVKHPAPIRAEM